MYLQYRNLKVLIVLLVDTHDGWRPLGKVGTDGALESRVGMSLTDGEAGRRGEGSFITDRSLLTGRFTPIKLFKAEKAIPTKDTKTVRITREQLTVSKWGGGGYFRLIPQIITRLQSSYITPNYIPIELPRTIKRGRRQ